MLPDTVIQKTTGTVAGLQCHQEKVTSITYKVDMHARRKGGEYSMFMNMLQKWHKPMSDCYLAEEGVEEEDDIPLWKNDGGEEEPIQGSMSC